MHCWRFADFWEVGKDTSASLIPQYFYSPNSIFLSNYQAFFFLVTFFLFWTHYEYSSIEIPNNQYFGTQSQSKKHIFSDLKSGCNLGSWGLGYTTCCPPGRYPSKLLIHSTVAKFSISGQTCEVRFCILLFYVLILGVCECGVSVCECLTLFWSSGGTWTPGRRENLSSKKQKTIFCLIVCFFPPQPIPVCFNQLRPFLRSWYF